MRLSLLLPLTLALPACVGTPPIVASPNACSTIIPDNWRDPIPGADLPETAATVSDWIQFGQAQTGQLDKANGRTTDALAIISRCEARDTAAIKKARPKVLGIF
jgi:hypothetical protein